MGVPIASAVSLAHVRLRIPHVAPAACRLQLCPRCWLCGSRGLGGGEVISSYREI